MKLRRQKYPTVAPITSGHLQTAYEDVGNVVNGSLEFGSPSQGVINMDGFWYVGKTPTAGTEIAVQHNLQRVPTGALTFSIDQAGIVYRSGTTWTTTMAYLKCNVSGANVTLFLT